MKIITVPDLHGKNFWKHIDISEYDKVVFLGDYVDSYLTIPPLVELQNFIEIIDLKKTYPDKIELLLGNHDIQYLFFPRYGCSVNYHIADELKEAFNSNAELFKVAFQVKNHLWTHAGVSKSWLDYYCYHFEEYKNLVYDKNLAEFLNGMLEKELHLLSTISESRGGTSYYGGVFWADLSDTSEDRLENMHQYIGHTKVSEIKIIGDESSKNHYLDCLDTKIAFYAIDV